MSSTGKNTRKTQFALPFPVCIPILSGRVEFQWCRRRAAPTLHRAWWRYSLHSYLVEDTHLFLLGWVSAPAHRMIKGALTQRDTIMRTFAVRRFVRSSALSQKNSCRPLARA